MKKFLIVLVIAMSFIGCTYKPPAKSKVTNIEYNVDPARYAISFYYLGYDIYVDTWTDVLYCRWTTDGNPIPIAKPDGTFLTYSELVKRYEENKWNVN